MRCPMAQYDGCGCYSDLALARALPEDIFQLYLSSRTRLAEQDLSAKLEKEGQAKLLAEIQKMKAMDEEERKVHAARKHLLDTVLIDR